MTRYKGSSKNSVKNTEQVECIVEDKFLPQISANNSSVYIMLKKEDFASLINTIKDYVAETLIKRSDSEKAIARYTVDEVVEKLHVSKNTLNTWRKTGYLKPIKVGSRVLYSAEVIENMLNGRN